MEAKELLNNIIKKYEAMVKCSTYDLIMDLKKLQEMLEVKVEEPKQIKEKIEIKKEDKPIEKDINQLRAEYKEKFNKNPFAGWSKEVLISKLK